MVRKEIKKVVSERGRWRQICIRRYSKDSIEIAESEFDENDEGLVDVDSVDIRFSSVPALIEALQEIYNTPWED